MANVFPAAPAIQVPIFPAPAGVFDLKRYGNAVGNGAADDTQALLNCIAACDAYVTYLGAQSPQGGAIITVPPGSYLIKQPAELRKRTTIQGMGFCSAFLFENSDGFIVDSGNINAEDSIWLNDVGVFSLAVNNGTAGFWMQGGVQCGVRRCTLGGWGYACRFTNANLANVEQCVFSTYNGVGKQDQIGVFLDSTVGGAANLHYVSNTQFNGCAIGVLSHDGVGNVFLGCNFNGCGEVARIRGGQGLTFERCLGEGVTSDTYFRSGTPGGEQVETVTAVQLAIRDCHWSRNEVQGPRILAFENNTQIRNLDLSGTQIAGAIAGQPPIKAAANVQETRVTYALQRDRVLISGSSATLRTVPGAATDLIDKPLFGTDLGRQAA